MSEIHTPVEKIDLVENNNVLWVEFTDKLGRKIALGSRDLTPEEAVSAHGE